MIERGGTNEERLYLHDLDIEVNHERVLFKKTDMPNMRDLVHRHMARYYLPMFFTRPDMKVLDFPCGSGYAYELFKGVFYEGRDNDLPTIEYARRHYNNSAKTFTVDDLTKPNLRENNYDIIACIEGLEHIDNKFQAPLISKFYKALKPSGILVITTPEAKEESGPNPKNEYHKWELTEQDFLELLVKEFDDVEILKTRDILHNGEQATCLYGICKKGEKEWSKSPVKSESTTTENSKSPKN